MKGLILLTVIASGLGLSTKALSCVSKDPCQCEDYRKQHPEECRGLSMVTPQEHGCNMPEGFHEWGVFGEKTVYLTHYPMFGSIHSYQIVVEATFSENGKEADSLFFAAFKNNPKASFSISPSKSHDGSADYWILPEYAKAGAKFNARLHFQDVKEVDHVVAENLTVTVKKVLIYHMFKTGSLKPSQLTYSYFGNREEAYLIHQPTWNPDFDQIVQVSPLAQQEECAQPQEITFADRKNEESSRIKQGENLSAISNCLPSMQIHVLNEIFENKINIQR